jgi:glycosyltransferase involved in cell wall biosynthesis
MLTNKQPLSVLVVTNMWPTPEAPQFGVFVEDQVKALRRVGADVEVMFINGRRSVLNYFKAFGTLRRRLRLKHFDVVHAHYALSAVVAMSQRRVPVVVTHHGIEVFEGWQSWVAALVSRRADHVVVVGLKLATKLKLDHASVVGNGVDLDIFKPIERREARRRLGINHQRPIVLFVGEPRPEKRLELIRAAVDIMTEDDTDCASLRVVTGKDRASVALEMNAGDVLALVSDNEGDPVVVKEALACNLPVVATDVGTVAATLSGVRGCKIVEQEAEAIAAGLRSVLAPTPRRLEGRQRMEGQTWDAMAGRLLKIYDGLVRRKLRVCIVRHGYYPEDPRVRREANALVEAGAQVDIICLQRPGDERLEHIDGVRVRRLPLSHRRGSILRYLGEYAGFLSLATVALTWRHLRDRYDLVQVNTVPDVLIFAAMVPRLLGVPVLLDMHEMMPELFASKYRLSHRHLAVRAICFAERLSAAVATHVLTVSTATEDVLRGRRIAPEKLSVVMNAPDEALFFPRPRNGDPPANIGDHVPLIATHGTLVARYGYRNLIEVLPRVTEIHPRAGLWIIGEGEERATLEWRAREIGVSDRVVFEGYVAHTEIPELIKWVDIGVVANEVDAFTDLVVPTKLMEYVAMGIPVVAPRSTAIARYFDEGDVAFFEPGDPADLAVALNTLATRLELAREKALSTRQAFLRRHSWITTQSEYTRLVYKLARA